MYAGLVVAICEIGALSSHTTERSFVRLKKTREDYFWELVESAKGFNPTVRGRVRALAIDYLTMRDDRKPAFLEWVSELISGADTQALRDFAGPRLGTLDDGYLDFRAWLVLQGKDFYYAAIHAPNAIGSKLEEAGMDEVGEAEMLMYFKNLRDPSELVGDEDYWTD